MRVETAGGDVIELGTTETSPTVSIVNYSKRSTDDFGVTTVVERGFARTMSVRLGVAFDDVDALQRRLADLRATPAMWVADERFGSLSFEGFYKEFELDLAVPPLSYCTLTVEGLAEATPLADTGGDPAPTGSASTLQLLQPVTVTDAVLIGSTIAETDYLAWVSATTYVVGDRVVVLATHRIYESVIAANVGHDPAAQEGQWLDIGPTNAWAMFDLALGSVTTADSQFSVTLQPGAVSALALLDVDADTVRVLAPGYDQTQEVIAGKAVVFFDMAVAAGANVTVIVARGGIAQSRVWNDAAAWSDVGTWLDTATSSASGDVSVGTLLVGPLVTLGVTESSPTAGITDYSRKDVDDFGEVTVVQRAFAKRMAAKALIRTDAIDLVASRIAAVRAQPSLWIGQQGLDSLTVYGFFKDFSIEVGETVSKLSLSIEGLSQAPPRPSGQLGTVSWPDVTDPLGTKPADNADVTADNTAMDTAHVGGRPTQGVLDVLDAAAAAAGDLGPIHDEIDAAVAAANAYADQIGEQADLNLGAAVQGLNTAIGLSGAAGQYAKDKIDDANSDLNQRIAAAAASGSGVGVRVTTIENRLDTPGTGIVARLTTTETLINQPGTGLAARTTTLETSLGAATNRLSTVEATLTTPGSGLVSRTTVLEASSGALDMAVNGAGGVNARLTTVESALYDQGTGVVARTSALETSVGSVSSRVTTIEQSFSSGNSNEALAQRTTTLETQMGDRTARLQTVETAYSDSNTGVARRLNDLNTSVGGVTSRLTTVESTVSDPTSGLVRRTDDLTVNYRPTGNLQPNSALTTLDGWTFSDFVPTGGSTISLNLAGVAFMLGGVENNLSLHQSAAKTNEVCEALGPPFAVTPGTTIQFYAYAMSHRARHWVSLYFYDAAGTIVGYGGEHIGSRQNEGGQDANAWEITGAQAYLVPAGAVAARMILRQYFVTSDGYTWFSRLFVGEVPAGCSTWTAYTPGDNRTVAAATIASLKSTQAVLGDATGGVVKQTNDLQVVYGGVNSRLGTVETVVGGPSSGLVQRVSTLETSGVGPDTTTQARINNLETAVTDGRFASALRTTTLEARADAAATQLAGTSGSNLLSRIQSTETAVTDGRFAATSYVNTQLSQRDTAIAAVNSRADTLAGTDAAQSARMDSMTAAYNGIGASLTTTAAVAAHAEGRVSSYWGIDLVAGGRARIRAYADGYGSLVDIGADVIYLGNDRTFVVQSGKATVNGDLYLGAGRIVMDNGSVMKVQGTGFGSANQFIEWFGARQASLASCTEANATYYLKVDGSAYFGGSLRAGVIRNAVQTTSTAADASVATGSVGSNGGSRSVVVSYQLVRNFNVYGPQGSGSGGVTAQVTLYQNGAAVATLNASGSWNKTPADGGGEAGSYNESAGGSITFTDNTGGAEVSYEARLTARTLGPGPDGSFGGTYFTQNISLVETEG